MPEIPPLTKEERRAIIKTPGMCMDRAMDAAYAIGAQRAAEACVAICEQYRTGEFSVMTRDEALKLSEAVPYIRHSQREAIAELILAVEQKNMRDVVLYLIQFADRTPNAEAVRTVAGMLIQQKGIELGATDREIAKLRETLDEVREYTKDCSCKHGRLVNRIAKEALEGKCTTE